MRGSPGAARPASPSRPPTLMQRLPVWALLLGLLLGPLTGCEPDVDVQAAAESAFTAGNYAAAADGFSQALTTARPEERAHLQARRGQALKLIGRNDAAEEALLLAVREADARSQGEVGARARRYLGRLYGDLGRLEEAEARYAEAEGWYRAHGPPEDLVKLQVNRAAIAWQAQDFDRAWTLYQDVYYRALTLESERLQANGLDGMAMLLAYVGEFRDARGLLAQTALMHETAGRRADAAVAYATQGIVALAEGDADEATRVARLALAHAEASDMKAAQAQARIVLAAAANVRGDAAGALEAADAAGTEAAAIGFQPLQQEATLVALEALANARRWSTFAARSDAFRPETPEQRARLETLQARAAQARGDAAAYRSHLEAAVAQFDRLRAALGPEHLSTALTRTRREAYDGLISLLAAQGEATAALRVVGGVKARAFAERLRSDREAEPAAPAAPAAGSESALPSRRTVERASNLFRLADVQPPADPMAVQAALTPDVAVIEYYVLPTELLVFWVSADAIEVHSVPVAQADLEREVERLLFEIRAKGNGFAPHAARLGQWLLDPVASRLNTHGGTANASSRLRSASRRPIDVQPAEEATPLLVVVPHGPLHPVPFEALPWAGRMVVDRYAVVTEPNLTAVAAALRMVAPSADPAAPDAPRYPVVIAVGDPRNNLPGAREEAAEVARRYTGAHAFLGDDARESTVRAQLASAGASSLIHFAVHGIRSGPLEPLYLELQPDSGSDGRLYPDELAALKLPAGLVVLSVCDSAAGRGEVGDEIPWVVDRAFLEGGANSVLASRWPVHDAASVLFMRNFYAALGTGDLIEAFHRAQLALRNGRARPEELGPLLAVLDRARGVQDPPTTRPRLKDFTHPYFWATFSLRGAWR